LLSTATIQVRILKFLARPRNTDIPIVYPGKFLLIHLIAGQEVVIVKNGTRICGTGGSLGTAAIMQDKAYFEVRLQQTGISSQQAYGAVH
jgi:hypothetical protein